MKQAGRALAALGVAGLLMISPARAEFEGEDSIGLERLEESAGEYAPEGDFEAGFDWNAGLGSLTEKAQQQLGDILRRAAGSGAKMLAIVLFCALSEELGQLGSRGFATERIVGTLALWAVAVSDVNSLMNMGREAIESTQTFTTVLIPVMTAAAAATGATAGAAARQVATTLFSELLMTLISKVLIPLTYGYLAASAGSAAIGNAGLKRLAKSLKGFISGVLTTVMVAFVGYLSVSGVVAGSTDAMRVKTAKMAISGMVPVVGGVLSDAAETVLAGTGMLKNAVGVFGMLVILGICLMPFLQLGAHYLIYKLSAALAGVVSDGELVELVDQVGSGFGLILGMTGSCALLMLISIFSCLNAAGVT